MVVIVLLVVVKDVVATFIIAGIAVVFIGYRTFCPQYCCYMRQYCCTSGMVLLQMW